MRRYSAKETYNFKEPPNRSHPIAYYGNRKEVERSRKKEKGGGGIPCIHTRAVTPDFSRWGRYTDLMLLL